MQIKGTSVKETLDYVKTKFPDRKEEWINSLPEQSKKIFTTTILTTNWYDLYNSQTEPQIKIAELFFDNNIEKAAFDLGRFGAFEALNGIYKIFVKIASLEFVVKRIFVIFSTYFSEEAKIKVLENSNNLIIISLEGFSKRDELEVYNISGWIDGLMTTINKKQFEIKYKIEDIENEKIRGTIMIEH